MGSAWRHSAVALAATPNPSARSDMEYRITPCKPKRWANSEDWLREARSFIILWTKIALVGCCRSAFSCVSALWVEPLLKKKIDRLRAFETPSDFRLNNIFGLHHILAVHEVMNCLTWTAAQLPDTCPCSLWSSPGQPSVFLHELLLCYLILVRVLCYPAQASLHHMVPIQELLLCWGLQPNLHTPRQTSRQDLHIQN